MAARLLCGVDEAGRGPLAGPVFAAAVILNPRLPIAGLADSKLLSARQREALSVAIKSRALAWAVAAASVEEIDTLNILRASLLAMRRAVEALAVRPDVAMVDGNQAPALTMTCHTLVGGDRLHLSISAASILAKTSRDAELVALDGSYPQYGFAQHKGYGTPQHLQALRIHGPCAIHRRTFGPVAQRILALDFPAAIPDSGFRTTSGAPPGQPVSSDDTTLSVEVDQGSVSDGYDRIRS